MRETRRREIGQRSAGVLRVKGASRLSTVLALQKQHCALHLVVLALHPLWLQLGTLLATSAGHTPPQVQYQLLDRVLATHRKGGMELVCLSYKVLQLQCDERVGGYGLGVVRQT